MRLLPDLRGTVLAGVETVLAVAGARSAVRPVRTLDELAHIHIDEPVTAPDARALEHALSVLDGVRWAAYNGALGQMVVHFDPAVVGERDLARAVDRGLGPHRGAHPGKSIDLMSVDTVVLGAEALAVTAAVVGRILRVVPLPAEWTAMPGMVDLVPAVRGRLTTRLGPARTQAITALAAAALAAAAQTPLTPLAGGALRVLRLAEARAREQAGLRVATPWYASAQTARADPPPAVARPCPLPDGPIERYAARAGTLTGLAAGAALLFPNGPRRAASVVSIGSPRAARQGRQAYAAQLGRLLAHRGVLVRDPAVLRRLDRVDTVVADATALCTGRAELSDLVAVPGENEQAVKARALAMLDAARPRRVVRRGDWTLRPLTGSDLSTEVSTRLKSTAGNRRGALGLLRSGRLVAAMTVRDELDPLATAVLAAARDTGRLLIAEPGQGLAGRLRCDGTLAGGNRLTESVRAQQRQGHGVLLIAAGDNAALAAADCGLGIVRAGRRTPWSAHLITGPGLDNAWLTLQATAQARTVSARSVKIAMLGSVAGTLLLLTAPPARKGRKAAAPGGAAGLANVIGGAWSATALGRRATPLPENSVPWHSLPARDVLRALETSPAGLTDAQADQRRVHDTDDTSSPGLLRATLEELDNPLTTPLAAGAAVSTATGGLTDAALVVAVQAANAVLGGAQRLAAGQALRQLVQASSLKARLLRDGQPCHLPAEDLVPGDILTLQAGDAAPADCRLIGATALEMDESSLTGESLPVSKSAEPSLAPAVADRTSMVYAGTTVAAGTATAVVTATGTRTEAGRGLHITNGQEPAGGVEARLHRLTAASLPVAGAAAALMLGNGLLRGQPGPALRAAVALAVAAVPEGMPFVATVAQLSAARRLSKHNVLVRHPRTMESLGRLDVVCFDKTGTLTEGTIRLRTVSDGRDHQPAGALTGHRREVLAAALRASPTASDNQLPPHPTDRAVLAGGQEAGVSVEEHAAGWRLSRELPFEPGRGFHAVLGDLPDGRLISVKGAPDTILPRCVAWHRPDTPGPAIPLTRADRRTLTAEVNRLAGEGLRVLAVAERPASARQGLDDDRVDRLEFRGLLGLADPVRATSADAVDRLRRAGITPIMLTGDHPGTAEAIAAELGILGERGAVKGPELEGLDDQQLTELVTTATVFARVSPAHKVTIVRALRQAGRVVAVTGDGANDAPAIRLADVGIALGTPGTAAAREAADMVVTDDRIETIVNAVIEGRAMWSSVRDAVALLLGGNLGEIVFTLASSLISPQPALNARQLLLINLVTDLLPAIALAARPPRHVTPEQLLREGPDRSLGDALTRDIAQRAIATTLAATGGWLAARMTGTAGRASTVALASLVNAQLAQTAMTSHGDPIVLASAGVSALALLGIIQTPGVSGFFGCRPLGPLAWTIVAAATTTGAIIGAIPHAVPLHRPSDLRRVRGGLVRTGSRCRVR